jgi:hypothetical protein
MNFAPFLLQAFAARVLATKQEAKISRAELLKQGYDVDVLIEMIEVYQALPEDKRGFTVSATAEDILIRRKANSAAPAVPTLGAPPNATAAPAPPAGLGAPGQSTAKSGGPAGATGATRPGGSKAPLSGNASLSHAKRTKPDGK